MTPRDIRALRERLGLTQAAFCERYAIGNQASLSDWESGRREPGIAAQTLLRLIDRDPAGTAKAIGELSLSERHTNPGVALVSHDAGVPRRFS